ncbi:GLPGLI family protein [Riemerella anatipestifer]|uniref:GLPGLI family protein n=1 Tax=Riemerella anatipestifer TaxID=34085 RepID=A0AAP6LK85_RIEAN|nr:GLPGLI family protein [Riemerella anatipestifer]MBT0548898.1 GLPGLI family protein [Riemerella anatipestifer]MBT0555212.1 GLPGLI family protein [Riemerella anatipestifer]MBT0559661.1 GLPGLI family protein [Riemerella anatipestifer]MCD5968045.1 GLPGLI family protein [Riemerella anatipestifer]MCO7354764.1 GLPGLI family protein [Riemerella anatipestifer]
MRILIYIILCSVGNLCFGQYRVDYRVWHRVDSAISMEHTKPYDMSLYIKNAKHSVYISPLKVYNDSLDNITKVESLGDLTLLMGSKKRGGQQREYIVANLEAQRIDQYLKVTSDWFKYSTTVPRWKLVEETKTIGTFICHKAITELSGRAYAVWYTEEIPISAGPFKLMGLPGLVLFAEDGTGDVKIELVAVQKSNKGIEDLNLMKENTSEIKNYKKLLELTRASFYNRAHPQLYDSFDQKSKKQADERYEARVRKYNNFIEK